MRDFSNPGGIVALQCRWYACAAVMIVLVMAIASPIPASAQATTQPAENAAQAVLFNEAIRAYLLNQFDDADRMLDELHAAEPQNIAYSYYSGLVNLERGLEAAGSPEQAKGAFSKARAAFQSVVEGTDPYLRPVEAALELGIAQLGSDAAETREVTGAAEELARSAAATLERYVASDVGNKDWLGHFYLGVAKYRLATKTPGNAAAARASFGRAEALANEAAARGALTVDEQNKVQTRVLYYGALLDLVDNRRLDASSKLKEVMDRDTSMLATNARKIREALDEQQRRNPEPVAVSGLLNLEGRFSIGQYYDDNVILLGHETTLPRGIRKKEDYRAGVDAEFDLYRRFTSQDGILGRSLRIGIVGGTSHLWQPSIREFDVNYYNGRVYVNWEPVTDLFAGIQYDYSYTQLGHEPYISSNRVTPIISKLWRAGGTPGKGDIVGNTDIYYIFDYRNYLDKYSDFRFDRDGNYHAVGIAQTVNLAKARDLFPQYYKPNEAGVLPDGADEDRWMSFTIGYQFRSERTQGSEFDLYSHGFGGGVRVPLPWRLDFSLGADFSWDNYTHPSVIDFNRNERFDFVQRYSFGLARTLVGRGEYTPMPTLQMRLRGGLEWTLENSNIWDRLGEDVYEYNRVLYGLQLLVNF